MTMARTALLAMFGVGLCVEAVGCGSSSKEVKTEGTTPVAETAATSNQIPPEKFEEIDAFFRGKTSTLQFDCYNPEVEKTGKKYQGYVSLLVVVVPGGKAGDVKVVSSSIKSEGIEQCIVAAAKGWEWPDVPQNIPYNGSIAFKPAW